MRYPWRWACGGLLVALAVIAFLIMAAVIYFLVVVPFTALLDRYKKEPEPDAPTRECPECLSSIAAEATRCMFCTAVSAPAAA